MNPLNLITEAYERQARLYPALLLVAPVVATAVAIMSAKLTDLQSASAALVGCGGAFLLTQLARDSGKKREPLLFQKWGGLPSVLIFRHRHSRFDSITKARYHKKLSTLVKGVKAPTPEDEEADPAAADEVYTAWSHYLRANTRDTKKHALLFQENVSYGYRRNVWGLRPIGITISALCSIVAGVRLWFIYRSTGQPGEEVAGALVVSLLFLALWLFRFTEDWVRVPADAYAERLAEAVETLGGKIAAEKK